MQTFVPRRLNRYLRLLSLVLLTGLLPTARAWADTGIFEAYAVLGFSGGTNTYYRLNPQTTGPNIPFNGTNLGTFATLANGGVLNFAGGQNKTFKNFTCNTGNTGNNISGGRIYYMVYPTGSRPATPSFNFVTLNYDGEINSPTNGDQRWTNAGNTTSLLTGLTAGNYTLEVYTEAYYDGCNAGTHYYSNNGGNYLATFSVSSLCGTVYTIDNTASPSATNFTSFTSAFNALNSFGVTCATTFVVKDGTTYAEVPPVLNAIAGASSTNTVTFVRSGAGSTRPVIAPAANSGTGAQDGIIRLSGTDFVTFNGIDVSDANSSAGTATQQMEFGYALFRASATDGCQNVNITNATITLNKANTSTIGIWGANTTAASTTALAATSTAGINSFIKLNGNTVTSFVGIYLTGNTAATGLADSDNEIGTTSGNTLSSLGGSNTSVYGIRAEYQNNLKIENNSVTIPAGNTSTTVRGIGTGVGTVTSMTGTLLINNNTIAITSATSGTVWGINQAGTSALTSSTVTNNKIQNCALTSSGTVSYIEDASTGSSQNTTLTGNQIINNSASTTGIVTGIFRSGATGTATINTNYIGITAGGTASANSMTGASGTFYGIRATTGTITVSGNAIRNNSYTATSGSTAVTLYGYYNFGSPTSETITNNIITDLSIAGTNSATTHALTGIHTNTVAGAVKAINGNTIGNLTLGASGGAPSGAVTGINQFLGTTIGLNQNKIYGLTAYGAAGTATGIMLNSGSTVSVVNNLIGNLTTPAATGSNAVVGVNTTGATLANLYYNTIYLTATGGAGFGSSGVFMSSTASTIELRNNIVINNSTSAVAGGTAALRRNGTNATNSNITANTNNNLYYANGSTGTSNVIFTDGTVTYQTLALYKAAVANKESLSITENTSFESTTGSNARYLHLNPAVATQAESGGLAFTGAPAVDYDGDARLNGAGQVTDIGADEGNYTAADLTGPGITYTTLGNTASTANRSLATTITDPSGVGTLTNAPRLYYRKNSGSYVFVNATTTAGSAYTFTIDYTLLGGVTGGDIISYYVAAQDNASTPNLSTNPAGGSGINPPGTTAPASPNQYTILPTLSGDYYIMGTATAGTSPGGASREFATLTAAAASYNANALGGAVRFLLFSNTQGTETYPINFGANADASSTNTLTIKPYTGVTTTFTNSTTTATFKTTSARYVIFDGSNTAGGTTRDLTLSNTSSSATAAALVWVASTIAAPSTGVQVKNLALQGAANGASATSAGVMVSNTTYNSATGGSANGVVISGNSVQGTALGVVVGNDTSTPGTGLQITNNLIGPATAATANNISVVGLFVQQATAPTITGNTVRNIIGAGTGGSIATGTSPTGVIFPAGVTGATFGQNLINTVTATGGSDAWGLVLGTGFTGGTVTRNQVLNISSASSAGWSGHGIDVSTSSTSANLTLSNNFVAGIGGSGWTTFTSTTNSGITGIRLYNGTQNGINLYYNSVNLTGSASNASSSLVSAALYVASSATVLNVQNNIFVNSINSATASGPKAYALYSAAANTAFTTLDYNDYFVNVPTNPTQGYIGAMNGTDAQGFAAFKTASGKDAASLNIDPTFTSNTNLHTTAGGLNGAATPISGITVDIDGDTRGTGAAGTATGSDIGADEFTPALVDVQATALVAPATSSTCYSTAENVTVTVKNNSTVDLNLALTPVQVTVNVTGATTQSFNQSFSTIGGSSTLAAGASGNVTFSSTLNMSTAGTYTFAVAATATGDGNTANDAISPNPTRTVVAPALSYINASPTVLCGSGTVTLTAYGATGGTVTWYSSADGYTTAVGTGSPLTLANVSATTTYRATVVCGSNVSANSNTSTVTVNTASDPSVVSPVTRCGAGTVTLTATAPGGTTAQYYAASTGGTPFATGATATATVTATPATQTFYASARSAGATSTAGLPSNSSSYGTAAGTSTANYALGFDVTQAGTLVSVDVYPTVAGTSTIQLYTVSGSQPGAGTAVSGAVVSRTFTTAELNTRVTVPLNFALTAGSYKLSNPSNGASFVRYASGSYTGSYPLASGSISVVGSYSSAANASFTNTAYNNFFNLAFTAYCESNRVPITVNVTTPPALTPATTTTSICSGSSTSVTYSGYTNLTVSPTTGASVSGQTVTFNPTATTTYTITGNDGTGPAGCTNTATATITVNPTPTAPTLTPSTPGAICAGGSTTVTATAISRTYPAIAFTATFNSGVDGFTFTNTGTGASGFGRYVDALGPDGTPYLGADADFNGSGTTTTTTAVSPTIDLSAYTAAKVKFSNQYYYYSSDIYARVEISSNGTTWTTLKDYRTAAVSALTADSIAIPSTFLGLNAVRIRFAYSSAYGDFWGFDNVVVRGTKSESATFAVSPTTGASVSGNTITFNPTTTTPYSVTATYPSSTGCPSPATPITITVNPVATANAGTAPAKVCAGYTYSTTGSYGGSATSATYTSSGSGTFSNGGVINGSTSSVTYSPSAADITAGSVTLTLTTSGPCAPVTSTLPLTINSSSTWTGAANYEWNNPANWNNCVPNLQVNATVPAGTPNSIADFNYYTPPFPALPSRQASVKTLTIASGATVELYAHDLDIAGDLVNNGDLTLLVLGDYAAGTNLRFVGSAAQSVTRMPARLYTVEVNKPSNNVAVLSAADGTGTGLSFQSLGKLTMTSGLLNLSNNTQLSLADYGSPTVISNGVAGFGPLALSETNTSYIMGRVRVLDYADDTTPATFGGLGLTVTPAAGSVAPGNIEAFRTTGVALNGAGTSQSVLRWFRLLPTTDSGLNVSLKMDLFDHERNGIANANLLLFSAPIPAGGGTPAGPWAPYRASALVAASNASYATAVQVGGLTHLSDWTLGNSNNPLPVELTKFTAQRQGSDAVLNWNTASEKNNAGFEVQVSTDGRAFRTLQFLEPASPTSAAPRSYTYTDVEKGKAGLRYYRLRQRDLDGSDSFSPVRTVLFDAALSSLTVAPNPFETELTLHVQVRTATSTLLTVTDATGRTVRSQQLALSTGQNQLVLPNLDSLPAGVYLLHLTVDGQLQHVKVVKE